MFYVGIVIYASFCLQCKIVGRESRQSVHNGGAALLHYQFLCRDHFLPTYFMTPEGIHLNALVVPLGLVSAPHSILQSSPPLLPTLSRQLSICKYLICVITFVYIYTVHLSFVLMYTELVLFSPVPSFMTGWENKCSLHLTLGTEVQYAWLHEQCYTTVTRVVGN